MFNTLAVNWKHRIIQVLAIGHIVVGVLLPFIGQIDFFQDVLLATMFPGIELSPAAAKQAVYVITLFGPTVASWGILLLVLANSYFLSPTWQKWYGLLFSVVVWCIGDTAYSVIHNVWPAVILNSAVAFALLVPIGLSRTMAR